MARGTNLHEPPLMQGLISSEFLMLTSAVVGLCTVVGEPTAADSGLQTFCLLCEDLCLLLSKLTYFTGGADHQLLLYSVLLVL